MTKPRILVVDDERIVSLDIQGALGRLGYQVAGVATTGADAVALVGSAVPDLVLMDVRLAGGMDGTEAALRIKQAFDIPVVFLTAHSDEQTMRRALAAAPFGYLIKPFEDRELRGAIELALAKHGAECDLRRARRVAEEADRAKTAFLGTLSHELRTPMNGILGMAELLLMGDLKPDQRETVGHLKDCAQSFTGILNQLLDFSSLEAGACGLEMQEFDLAAFLEDAVARHRGLAVAKGLAFSVRAQGLPERIVGSPGRMRQALDHLLDNAVAYTEQGSVVVEALVEPGGLADGSSFVLLLRVRDTGCGISPEFLPRVFESFTQAEDFMTRRHRGLGLGLAMCRKAAECLGGRVSVESVPSQGSAFSLSVPLRRCCPATGDRGQGPLGGARVLVVEGRETVLSPLAQAIDMAGGRAFLASGGAHAARMLASSPVEAVVYTSFLDSQEALSLTRMLRSGLTQVRAGIPVLGLLPQASPAERGRWLMAGMDAVLTDTADSLQCIERLEELLSRDGSADSNISDRQGADEP